jgi:hypothetical protein
MSYVFFHPSAMQPGFFIAISFGRKWELRATSNSDGNSFWTVFHEFLTSLHILQFLALDPKHKPVNWSLKTLIPLSIELGELQWCGKMRFPWLQDKMIMAICCGTIHFLDVRCMVRSKYSSSCSYHHLSEHILKAMVF